MYNRANLLGLTLILIITSIILTGCSGGSGVVITHDAGAKNVSVGSTVNFVAETKSLKGIVAQYKWIVSSGSVIFDSDASMEWKAPEQPGKAIISVEVLPQDSLKPVTATLELLVTAPPEIVSYSEQEVLSIDENAMLSVAIKDLDTPLNELIYSWSVNGTTIGDALGPVFHLTPDNPGRLKVAVTISDGIHETVHQWHLEVVEPDSDQDGLTDSMEMAIGTNPEIEDTDGDGISDYTEVCIGTNPLMADSDGDGIYDGYEVARGTNPLVADTDGDGVDDHDDIAPCGDAYLRIQIRGIELSPTHLAENPSQIFFEVYIDGQKVARVPENPSDVFIVYAGDNHEVGWEGDYDLPEDRYSCDVSIRVMEKDTLFHDIIDVNPYSDEKSVVRKINLRTGFDVSEKSDGTLDGQREEDGILDYGIRVYSRGLQQFSIVEGVPSGQYILEGNSLKVFGFTGDTNALDVGVSVRGQSGAMTEKALVRSNVYISQIELSETTPQIMDYSVKKFDGEVSLELYSGTFAYPDQVTYDAYHQEQLEKVRAEQERVKRLASQSGLAYSKAKDYVKQRLKAPSTAKFPFQLFSTDVLVNYLGDGQYLVRSYVDSQNSFGAMIRTYFQCVLQYNDRTESMGLISLTFDE